MRFVCAPAALRRCRPGPWDARGRLSQPRLGIGRFRAGTTEVLPHEPAHLEFDGALRRHLHAFERFGVLGDPRSPRPGLENAEISELQAIILTQLPYDLVKEGLNDPFYLHPLGLRAFRDAVDEFFLGYCRHTLPHLKERALRKQKPYRVPDGAIRQPKPGPTSHRRRPEPS